MATTDTAETVVARADAAYALLDFHELGRETWREACHTVERQLAADLAAVFPTTVADQIWRRAWEDGHSEGYYSVAQNYETLAELVQEAEGKAMAFLGLISEIALHANMDALDDDDAIKTTEFVQGRSSMAHTILRMIAAANEKLELGL